MRPTGLFNLIGKPGVLYHYRRAQLSGLRLITVQVALKTVRIICTEIIINNSTPFWTLFSFEEDPENSLIFE